MGWWKHIYIYIYTVYSLSVCREVINAFWFRFVVVVLYEQIASRFRRRYSGEYEGMSTSDLAGDLRRDVEHYRGLWRTARGADEKVCWWVWCIYMVRDTGAYWMNKNKIRVSIFFLALTYSLRLSRST